MAHDIFISYSTKDQKVVDALSAYLEQNGIGCFVAYRDIPNGIVWAKAVTEAIESCKLMIVVFSENFNSSKQVDREIEMCIEEGKSVLTFKIENVEFKGVKKYFLKNLNWIDAFPNPENSFKKLYDNVVRLIPEIGAKKSDETMRRLDDEVIRRLDDEVIEPEKEDIVKKPLIKKNTPINQKDNTAKSSLTKNNNFNKRIFFITLLIIFGVAAVVASVLFFIHNKSQNIPEDNTGIIDNSPEIEEVVSNVPDTNILTINKIEPEKEKSVPCVTPVVNTNCPKKTEKVNPTTNQKTETVKIVYTESAVLISTSGEQFEVEGGDSFVGDIEKATGKLIQGRILDKDKKTKRLVMVKRQQ